MVFGVLLAGGVGSRMGNMEKPKQYLNIADRPNIFLNNAMCDKWTDGIMCYDNCLIVYLIFSLNMADCIHNCFISCLTAGNHGNSFRLSYILFHQIFRMANPLFRAQYYNFFERFINKKLFYRMKSNCPLCSLYGLLDNCYVPMCKKNYCGSL